MDEGCALSLTCLRYGQFTGNARRAVNALPRAAVLSVPNGKLRSETGSQTSISPSRMILRMRQSSPTEPMNKTTHSSTRGSNATEM